MTIHTAYWIDELKKEMFVGEIEWKFSPSLLSGIVFLHSRQAYEIGRIEIPGVERWRAVFRLHLGLMPFDEGYWYNPPKEILAREIERASLCTDAWNYALSLIEPYWSPTCLTQSPVQKSFSAVLPEQERLIPSGLYSPESLHLFSSPRMG